MATQTKMKSFPEMVEDLAGSKKNLKDSHPLEEVMRRLPRVNINGSSEALWGYVEDYIKEKPMSVLTIARAMWSTETDSSMDVHKAYWEYFSSSPARQKHHSENGCEENPCRLCVLMSSMKSCFTEMYNDFHSNGVS